MIRKMIQATRSSVLAAVFVLVLSYCTVQVSSVSMQSNGVIIEHDQSSSFHNTFHEDPGQYRSASSKFGGKMRSKVSKRGHIELLKSPEDKSLTLSTRVDCSFKIGHRTYYNPTSYGATCMCGSSGRGRVYAMEDAVRSCVTKCMKTHHGSVCLADDLHSGFEDEFSACCAGCSGKRSTINVTSSTSQTFSGRFRGCIADEKPPACEIEVDQLSSLVLPNIIKRCKCGGSSSGRVFVVCESMKSCMEPCMSADEGQQCERSTIIPAAISQFTTCCNTCSGHVTSTTFGSTTYTSCI